MARPERLLELYHLLSEHRVRTLDEIAQRFDVSKRTVYRDLETLEEQYVPIVRDDRGVRLMEGATLSLKRLNLTVDEAALLRLALGHPAFDRTPSLARRRDLLSAKLDLGAPRHQTGLGGSELGSPERSGDIDDDLFSILEVAIDRRRAVEIHYDSLSGGTRRWRGVDPYAIFHRAGAWYLVGRCHEADEPRIFRLDRANDVREAPGSFEADGFDLDGYLDGAWGAYRTDERHDVVVHFDLGLAPLLENARHLPEETVERLTDDEDDGTLEYRATVAGLDEFARWVVGFGEAAQVVEPPALRERVREIAEGAAAANRE